MENKEDYYSFTDIVGGARAFLHHLSKKWWLFIIAAALGAAAGFLLFYIQKPKYEAECTFILEEKQGGMGGLGSIASQFGIDMGGMSGGGSLFAGDNILDILKSRKVVQKVLLTKTDTAQATLTLADTYLDFSHLKKNWQNKPALAGVNFKNASSLSPVQDSVLNIIYNLLLKKHLSADRSSKKGTIIKVKVAASDMVFSKLLAERLVDEASKMYLNIKIGTAQRNIERMQFRSDSLLALLNRKSYTAASSQMLDANPGLKTALVPVEIATRDKSVIAALYTEVTKNLEASKMLLSQQTPVIQPLDLPGITLYDNKKGLLFFIIIGIFAFVAIVVTIIGLVHFMKRS
jgi:hypothetical protein